MDTLLFLLFLFSAEWSRLTASLTDPDLVKLATVDLPALLLQPKATSTTKQYFAAWKKWELWAVSKSGIQEFPVIPFHLSLCIAHLVQSGLKSSAVMATSAIKHVHSLAGFQNPAVVPLVTLALEGHKRVTAAPTLRKEPITADILLMLLGSHGHSNATLADLRTLFISFISYAGFLRFDDLIKITRKDCSISQDCLTIHITKSKNDQFRQGSEVFIARTFRESCPVAIAERSFAALGDPVDCALPLVRRLTKTKRGLIPTSHPLSRTRTRESVLNAIKPFVPDIKSYSLHSLRSGGASAASNAHVPPLLISRHGRWRSEKARNVYLQADTSSKLLASRSLGI